MKVFLIVFFCLCSLSVLAQNAKIDSLEKVIATTKSDTVKGRTLCRLCDALVTFGELETALQKGQEGLKIVENHKDIKGRAICLYNLGFLHFSQNDFTSALECYQKSLYLYKQLNEYSRVANTLKGIGDVYERQTLYTQAINYYEQSRIVYGKINDHKGLAECINRIGVSYFKQSNFNMALQCFHKSIKYYENANFLEGVAFNLCLMGNIYDLQGATHKALDVYQKALRILEKEGKSVQVAGCLTDMALIYEGQKEYSKSLEILHKGLKIYKYINHVEGEGICLFNIARVYHVQKQIPQAIKYNLQSLQLFEQIGNKAYIANVLNNLAMNYKAEGRYAIALDYCRKSLSLAEAVSDQNLIAETNINIGELYRLTGKISEARTMVLKGNALAYQIKIPEFLWSSALTLYQIDSSLGDYKASLEWYKQYKLYSDSLHNEDKAKEFGRLEAKYQYDKEKEAHAREEAIAAEKRTWIAFTTGGGIVILLSFMGVLYKNYREKKRINQQLLEQNEEISSQNEQIALQRDELNHYNAKLLENNAVLNEQNEEIRAQSEQISQQRDQLEQTNAQLKALDEFKEAMAGMIVHDLKNPLNAIIGLSAKIDLRENDRVMIHQAGKQMLNLTLNILDVQKFEQAEVPLNLQDHPLADIASDAFAQVSLLATNKNLKLILEIESGTGVHADFELISRVFMNLLTNAIKYTPNNGKITISAEKTNHHITVAVSDTGQGIPANKLHTVFDKFSQVEAKKSGIARSTGLGLTFCKMVVEAHGGRIWVTSKVNVGTTFYFNLPEAHTEVTATEQSIDMILEIPVLNDADKNVLAEYLPALQALDVYEGSEVLQILASITGSPAVHHWKNEIENAIFSSNQERYEELVRI